MASQENDIENIVTRFGVTGLTDTEKENLVFVCSAVPTSRISAHQFEDFLQRLNIPNADNRFAALYPLLFLEEGSDTSISTKESIFQFPHNVLLDGAPGGIEGRQPLASNGSEALPQRQINNDDQSDNMTGQSSGADDRVRVEVNDEGVEVVNITHDGRRNDTSYPPEVVAEVTPNNLAGDIANNQRPEVPTALAPNSDHAVAMSPSNGNAQAASDTDSLSTLQGERVDVVPGRFHRSQPHEAFQPGEYISDETETLTSRGNPQLQ